MDNMQRRVFLESAAASAGLLGLAACGGTDDSTGLQSLNVPHLRWQARRLRYPFLRLHERPHRRAGTSFFPPLRLTAVRLTWQRPFQAASFGAEYLELLRTEPNSRLGPPCRGAEFFLSAAQRLRVRLRASSSPTPNLDPELAETCSKVSSVLAECRLLSWQQHG